MEADLADLIAKEEAAAKSYDEMMAAKAKEIEALTAAVEAKLTRLGEVGVEIVNMKEDLDDTQKSLEEDKKFLADMNKICEEKKKEWAERCKTRAAELLALAETIKILNDDDALELFKKTLPSPAASFVEIKISSSSLKSQALAI